MKLRIRSALVRVRRSRRLSAALAALAVAALAVLVLPLLLPVWGGLAVIGICLAGILAFAAKQAIALRNAHRGVAESTLVYDSPTVGQAPADSSEQRANRLARVGAMLEGGFPESALALAKDLADDARIPASRRRESLRAVLDWYLADDAARSEPAPRSHFDVVLITHLGLPGGNTSASAADIRACRGLGLTVGLVHHPVLAWRPDAAVNESIAQLVDGKGVRIIGHREEVTCDLAMVRLPTVLVDLLEARPQISARKTVVIANQTPYRFYGPTGPREAAWDLPTVDRNVSAWLGTATWYAGGPAVRRVLAEQHSPEFAGIDLAAAPWNECIDVELWKLNGRREKDGRIRIGRHSRDHRVKWPEDPQRLRLCYPEAKGIEIHVLGGAETPRQLLGRLPSNWTVHPFGALGPREFLGGIDVFAYFIASDGAEAFGRAPLEAMAAGVPVIMDRVFQPTFGDAALYCEPEDVAATARLLTDDDERYASRQAAAWAFVEEHCSPRSLAERLSRHGVDIRASLTS